jgi:hypothetical protein
MYRRGMSSAIRAFQIVYDENTKASRDPDLEPLDNSDAARPDWYEYWPIRNYLTQNGLDESTYYGFLSPTFTNKTRLTARRVKEFIRNASDADVITFSPFPCHAACFLNVFEQGELFHTGLMEAASRFLSLPRPGVDLKGLVTHSRNTVFCNFVFAKAPFWRAWKEILDQMFDVSETPSSRLHALLNRKLDYVKDNGVKKAAPMKIFVMERVASFLLATTESFATKNYPPFEMPLTPAFVGHLPELVILDALKIAFSETGDPHFLQVFTKIRKNILPAPRR